MSILPDLEIVESLENDDLTIEPFEEDCLTPNGYDLRVDEVYLPASEQRIEDGVARIPSQFQFFVSTAEFVGLPPTVCAQLWLRTTWIRRGIMAGLGKVDAGFEGTLTFSAFNFSDSTITLPIGERFVQIVFERLSSPPSMTYEERSGNYQGQRGITLSPDKIDHED